LKLHEIIKNQGWAKTVPGRYVASRVLLDLANAVFIRRTALGKTASIVTVKHPKYTRKLVTGCKKNE